MNIKIKFGGCYKTKDNAWLIINKKYNDNTYKCIIVDIDEDYYDQEITDLTEEQILDMIEDVNQCYVPKWNKKYGLYAVWDGANKNSIQILQKSYIEFEMEGNGESEEK